MIVTTSLIATKLTHQRRPERAHLLERKKIQAPLAHGGVHHDELAPRIDVDPLPVRAPEHEHPALAREDPRLVAVPSLGVAVPGHTFSGSDSAIGRPMARASTSPSTRVSTEE